jgi:hypothetical protein
VIDLKNRGLNPRAIRTAIDTVYAAMIDSATPTPYPPA